MKILIVNCNYPIADQLWRISKDTNIPLSRLTAAWDGRDITEASKALDIAFDLIPKEPVKETQQIEKRLSY